jgi:signal transduction histidine kinase
MRNAIPITEFAPAERVSIEVVQRQAADVAESNEARTLLNVMQNVVLILNQQRQIVFASDNMLNLMSAPEYERILGLRPGEALNCIHARENAGGCGTTEFCSQCGVVKAILKSLQGQRGVEECRITRMINCQSAAMDLMVVATPFHHHDELYSLVSVMDISHLKRRQALERVFFHDLINSAGGLVGLMDIMKQTAPPAMQKHLDLARITLNEMMEEVLAQKDLAAAERNEYSATCVPIRSEEVLNEIVTLYQNHPVSRARRICLSPKTVAAEFSSDPILLKRVLGNMIKNALEAVPSGETVTVGCDRIDGSLQFWVQNPAFMPRDVQLQVFSRSFSTKEHGRGLGTYSIKLLTERYLKGSVRFETTPEQGTTFFVNLPLVLPA